MTEWLKLRAGRGGKEYLVSVSVCSVGGGWGPGEWAEDLKAETLGAIRGGGGAECNKETSELLNRSLES